MDDVRRIDATAAKGSLGHGEQFPLCGSVSRRLLAGCQSRWSIVTALGLLTLALLCSSLRAQTDSDEDAAPDVASPSGTAAPSRGTPTPRPTDSYDIRITRPLPQTAVDRLGGRLAKLVADKDLGKSSVGVHVVLLPNGQELFAHHARRPLMPASNLKLVSTWAAVETLGPTFQFETTLAMRGNDLVVFGSGDPALGDPLLASQAEVDVTWMFDRWQAALVNAGIREVGQIIIDDSLFEPPSPHPSWPVEQLSRWYCAPVGGLNFQTNCLDVFTRLEQGKPQIVARPPTTLFSFDNQLRAASGTQQDVVDLSRPANGHRVRVAGVVRSGLRTPASITVPDPGLFFGHAFKAHLSAGEVSVRGEVVRQRLRDNRWQIPLGPGLRPVAVFRSPLMRNLARANQQSQNLYAESLFKASSAYGPPPADAPSKQSAAAANTTVLPIAQGSWERSRELVTAMLVKLGVPADELVLDDGCGLSRKNRLSPRSLTAVLTAAFRADYRVGWIDSLASSDQTDSTLRRRSALQSTQLRGHVFAKTGFINGVTALSGYVRSGGRWAAFSVIVNGAVGPGKDLQDAVGREVATALATE